jgi:hypothetical protein
MGKTSILKLGKYDSKLATEVMRKDSNNLTSCMAMTPENQPQMGEGRD